MNKKKKIICVILIAILILCYLGRQAINYFWFYNIEYYTDSSYDDWMEEFEIQGTLNILKKIIE